MLSALDWNLVVTAHGGRRRDLVSALRPIVRLRRAGYAEVLVGLAPDVDACLAAIADRAVADPVFAAEVLARVVPVVRTFALGSDIAAELVERIATVPLEPTATGSLDATPTVLDALAGQSFHVRVERRGHRRLVQSDDLERRLGTTLVEGLRARGATPHVTFADPDLIVAVELIGSVGGVGLVAREHRMRYPFVRL